MFVISLEENGSVPDASWSVKGEARYALMPAWDGQNLRGIDAPRDVAKRLGAQAAVTAEELFKLRGGLLALKPGESLQFYVKESKSQGSASDLAGHYSWSETVKDGTLAAGRARTRIHMPISPMRRWYALQAARP